MQLYPLHKNDINYIKATFKKEKYANLFGFIIILVILLCIILLVPMATTYKIIGGFIIICLSVVFKVKATTFLNKLTIGEQVVLQMLMAKGTPNEIYKRVMIKKGASFESGDTEVFQIIFLCPFENIHKIISIESETDYVLLKNNTQLYIEYLPKANLIKLLKFDGVIIKNKKMTNGNL